MYMHARQQTGTAKAKASEMDAGEIFEFFRARAEARHAGSTGSQTESAGGPGAAGSARPGATTTNQGGAPEASQDTDGG
jgi:hypothetical protein